MTTPTDHTDHNDSVSGPPYSPPPWGRLPPPMPGEYSATPPPPHPVFGPDATRVGGDGGGGKRRPWVARHKVLTGLGVFFTLAVIGGVAGGNSGDPAPKVALPTATQAPYPTPPQEQKDANASASHAPKAPPAPTATVAPAKPATPALTAGQKQAVGKAQDYLGFTNFSKSGLVEQLVFDDFTKADATFAVDYIKVDWNKQAAGKVKDYLGFTHFSRAGLIGQLEFDGFTRAQAVYAADQVGL